MSVYYIKQGYALAATDGNETGHWFGGEICSDGACCPGCRNHLLLLADIDCKQLRALETAKLFQKYDRLPLYFCWRCDAAVISYSIIDSKQIKVLRYEGEKGDSDFPYNDYPISFPRRPISLMPIDYHLAKLLSFCQEIDEYWLSDEDLKLLEDGISKLRHNKFGRGNTNRHQLGGLLRLIQKHRFMGCPNSCCKRHKQFYEDKALNCSMKELAVIFNDPISGLPMVDPVDPSGDQEQWDPYVQVVFYVCDECLAITAMSQFA
jgi:hypothetical protein